MTDGKMQSLVTVSRSVGENPAYVQGGGGNTSVKLDDTRMAVKASGGLLKDMTCNDGFSIVDYRAIEAYLDNPHEDDDEFCAHIRSLVLEKSDRPSMETGFHAQLDTFVIHTHSIYANLLTCTTSGAQLVRKWFPEALWLNYVTPGRPLTLAIKGAIRNAETKPYALFLQNHGLIVSAPTAQQALEHHEQINEKIINSFKIDEAMYVPDCYPIDLDFIRSHMLFPDQVVYTQANQMLLESDAAQETLWAYSYILDTVQKLGLEARFLNQDDANTILGLDSEKHRQSVTKV